MFELGDTPVVVLQGARQVGKSTLAATIATGRSNATLVTLDDEPVRRAALTDPAGFIEGFDGLTVIDEVQRAPELLLAIKARVDRRRTPGQLLLTGSANLRRLRSVHDSLAGRAVLYTGTRALPLGDRLTAQPIEARWR